MFQGSMVALVTPMSVDGSVDEEALAALLEFHIDAGTDAIVAVGTTGESATLSVPEHAQVIELVVNLVGKRIPVIAGTGANATAEAVELTRHAKDAGADACLLVTPYYNKPTQLGLFEHFRTIANAVAIPQILYNVPGRTALDMQVDTTARLSRIGNIVGIKEALGEVSRIRELLAACDPGFMVVTGDDATAMESMLAGGHGDISVTANVVPQQMHAMCMAAMAGDRSAAEAIEADVADLHVALFHESNPIPVKWALQQMGHIKAGMRLPLTPLDAQFHASVRAALKKAGGPMIVQLLPEVMTSSMLIWPIARPENRSAVMPRVRRVLLMGLTLAVGSGCASVYQPNSPDVAYSSEASAARQLQVPPDLTDVSDGEQFVLPGSGNASVSRNTLLPEFSSVRFVRQAGQSWLEVDRPPEELWPRLLAFARKERYRIEQTEPVSGVIVTQWRPKSDAQTGGLLKNLLGSSADFTRMAFRLERSGTGARLFARSQAADKSVVTVEQSLAWPVESHDPENTSALLARLLVFLGIDEQRSNGILDEAQANGVLNDAEIQTTAAGSQLIIHRGYQPAFSALQTAMLNLNYAINSSDGSVGRIEAIVQTEALIVAITPMHVSAVRVLLSDSEGRRLPAERERALLGALVQQLT